MQLSLELFYAPAEVFRSIRRDKIREDGNHARTRWPEANVDVIAPTSLALRIDERANDVLILVWGVTCTTEEALWNVEGHALDEMHTLLLTFPA